MYSKDDMVTDADKNRKQKTILFLLQYKIEILTHLSS